MKIYLAGGISGNLKPLWNDFGKGRKDAVKLYLAGAEHGLSEYINKDLYNFAEQIYILETFYYMTPNAKKLIPLFKDFLLDSGAFTFMQNQKGNVNWNDYIESYADFINKNKISKFFELDIDSVVGYKEVLKYRKILEKLTNKQTIPVWHTSRGYKEFLRMCDEYNYICNYRSKNGKILSNDG